MWSRRRSRARKMILSEQKLVIVGIHRFSASVSLAPPLHATELHFVLFRCQKLRMRDDSVLQFWIIEWEWRGGGTGGRGRGGGAGSNTSVDGSDPAGLWTLFEPEKA